MATTWSDVSDKLDGLYYPPQYSGTLPIILLTWSGAGVSMWDTTPPQPAAVGLAAATAFPQVFYWQPVGNYPASITNPPLGQSVDDGYNEGVRLATQVWTDNLIIPLGYSEGAICGSHWWRDYILANNLASRVPVGLMWGNPCRSPGLANGNAYAGWGMPGLVDGVLTGGIAGPDDLTPDQTPSNWLDFVWLGSDGGATELYSSCPVGPNPWTAEAPPGYVETTVYNAVYDPSLGTIEEVAEDVGMPIADAEAIANGLYFLGAGAAALHYNYDITPMVNYLTNVVAPIFA